LNHPSAAAMRPYVKLLWPLVIIIKGISRAQDRPGTTSAPGVASCTRYRVSRPYGRVWHLTMLADAISGFAETGSSF